MARVPAKLPAIVKYVFPNYVWNVNTNKKHIYLTFDDGPTPKITPWVLDQLQKYNAKATFFCIGNNVDKHPEIFNQILSQGHTVGNHTYNHIKGWKTNTNDYVENVIAASKVISSKLFRPPYGRITRKQAHLISEKGFKIIMWSVISVDWDKSLTKETCLNNVIKNTKKGSIVVFHDSVKASKNMQYALPKVLEYYSKKGYEFKSLQ
ncbi:polysaccharide deacetylase family protein [Mangrovimonas spongiae]|uniref:Polysaccharide deacetylase family protein n=1 Tax=Mangrovimonas spongiae TaxID=2494697 RepID=A0A428K044_9FLAO|nr:polysaccharide deacetylase family protein [Mangrovimonas spongiae]RSK39765.1 polysaccharide deacetylase family protein [Mangrovimonas spongiae]